LFLNRLSAAEFDAAAIEPGDGWTPFIKRGFSQDRVVAASIKCHAHDWIRQQFDPATGLDKLA